MCEKRALQLSHLLPQNLLSPLQHCKPSTFLQWLLRCSSLPLPPASSSASPSTSIAPENSPPKKFGAVFAGGLLRLSAALAQTVAAVTTTGTAPWYLLLRPFATIPSPRNPPSTTSPHRYCGLLPRTTILSLLRLLWLLLPESAGIQNNNHQIGDVSTLDDGSESEQEIHPIHTKLSQDVLRHFRQQLRNLDPSGSPSEKWRHLVPWFDITDMRLRYAHSNVSHTSRQPPHRFFGLALCGCVCLCDGSPDYGCVALARAVSPLHWGGCYRDAPSPGPHLPHACCFPIPRVGSNVGSTSNKMGSTCANNNNNTNNNTSNNNNSNNNNYYYSYYYYYSYDYYSY